MIKTLLSLLLLVIFSGPSFAQQPPPHRQQQLQQQQQQRLNQYPSLREQDPSKPPAVDQQPAEQAQPTQKASDNLSNPVNSFFTDGPKKLREMYKENKQWLDEKTRSSKEALRITEGMLSIAQDPEIQKAFKDVAARFRFKPLLLAEVLLLILTLVFRASRPTDRSIMLRFIEQMLITWVYMVLAVLVVPTVFMGTNYLSLIWNLSRRLITLFYPALGPVSQ